MSPLSAAPDRRFDLSRESGDHKDPRRKERKKKKKKKKRKKRRERNETEYIRLDNAPFRISCRPPVAMAFRSPLATRGNNGTGQ